MCGRRATFKHTRSPRSHGILAPSALEPGIWEPEVFNVGGLDIRCNITPLYLSRPTRGAVDSGFDTGFCLLFRMLSLWSSQCSVFVEYCCLLGTHSNFYTSTEGLLCRATKLHPQPCHHNRHHLACRRLPPQHATTYTLTCIRIPRNGLFIIIQPSLKNPPWLTCHHCRPTSSTSLSRQTTKKGWLFF